LPKSDDDRSVVINEAEFSSSSFSSSCSYDIVSSIKQRGVTKVYTKKMGVKRSGSEHANLVSIHRAQIHRFNCEVWVVVVIVVAEACSSLMC
jgi:hypothetical protein